MLEKLDRLPDDPILGTMAAFRRDTAELKVDLAAGVYQDQQGNTPVLRAVREAEQRVHDEQKTKTYEGMAGNPQFNEAMQSLVFGPDHPAIAADRVATVQTTGGSGALHIVAEVLRRANPEPVVWVSGPTWPNHRPLIQGGGLKFSVYPYYDKEKHGIDIDGMLTTLANASAGDVVLLHGCCHNPTGADLARDQWDALVDVLEQKQLLPWIDMAYQGFARGIDVDAYGARLCAERLPEAITVTSCSKNFGVYRDRVGSASIVARDKEAAAACGSHLANVTRTVYSMPPAHGAAVINTILRDEQLRQMWLDELAQMRDRINSLRATLADALAQRTGSSRFSFIAEQTGMFSLMGLTEAQVNRLREEFHVYMVGSSRANIAGVRKDNLEYLADSITAVL
ncbi:MAG: aspartate/tyrosine/aromatic aminotransferase [Gammaproteobacteria bacterium]|nr:aspartate/tyrosine/aromatic aminotransferase [Gammaproteobacteria bacterium]NNF61329.1 aspartate/tyrosine/aromatic aminotransferase [Gammaproteobacteria bacterium]NNM20758.1 aspartate/tyrosine/aromatic aminotransferase [Gammaproteobacteria bacterium]